MKKKLALLLCVLLTFFIHFVIAIFFGRIIPTQMFDTIVIVFSERFFYSLNIVLFAIGQYLIWKHGKVGLGLCMLIVLPVTALIAGVWATVFLSQIS